LVVDDDEAKFYVVAPNFARSFAGGRVRWIVFISLTFEMTLRRCGEQW
jgi:hypothetical protein